MADDQERLDKLQEAIERKQNAGSRAQAQEVERYLLTQPTQGTVDVLWRRIVTGLLLLIGVLGAGLVVLIAIDKPTDAILPIVTALISGLLGLFVTPGQSGS